MTENITFYEALEADLNTRIRAWQLRHPDQQHSPRVTVHLSYSAWNELMRTLPRYDRSAVGKPGEIRLWGGVRCVEYRGKWTKNTNYTVKIKPRHVLKKKQGVSGPEWRVSTMYGMDVITRDPRATLYDPKA